MFDVNPFTAETRNYPIDFPHPIQEQLIVNLEIPAGYTVQEIPEQTNVSLPKEAAHFQYLISHDGNKLQLVSKIKLQRLKYSSSEYKMIKDFFDRIIEKQGEQIVLKKT